MNKNMNAAEAAPTLTIRTLAPQCRTRVSGSHAAAYIAAEMRALGISKTRLVRHARRFGITEARTLEVLLGAGEWNMLRMDEWLAIVQTAWRS